ncbi:hypothetical protein AXF42_Ash021637 [Apostasia shenzhenica]|uniref:Uncharacterized protein n=1 Tax=Apostasia shenzhenica TaxID=1088818 RepID=A0A2H9ZUB4_9ASPA|nr:hypothetical protein AXF42_Ash021637 [Apostasia shenzhenica]
MLACAFFAHTYLIETKALCVVSALVAPLLALHRTTCTCHARTFAHKPKSGTGPLYTHRFNFELINRLVQFRSKTGFDPNLSKSR